MKFIGTSAEGFVAAGLTIGCILALAGSILLLFVFSQNVFSKLPEWKWPSYVTVILFGLSVLCLLGYTVAQSLGSSNLVSEISREIESIYGVELDRPEVFGDLQYPETKPEKDLEIFGSVERNGEDIYLIWRDGQFELATLENTESFTELPRS